MRQPTKWATATATGGGGYAGTLIGHPCRITGILVQTDGVNDPTITVYNNTSAAGDQIIPSTAYDASALGLNGATNLDIPISIAVHVVIACAGAAKLYVYYL